MLCYCCRLLDNDYLGGLIGISAYRSTFPACFTSWSWKKEVFRQILKSLIAFSADIQDVVREFFCTSETLTATIIFLFLDENRSIILIQQKTDKMRIFLLEKFLYIRLTDILLHFECSIARYSFDAKLLRDQLRIEDIIEILFAVKHVLLVGTILALLDWGMKAWLRSGACLDSYPAADLRMRCHQFYQCMDVATLPSHFPLEYYPVIPPQRWPGDYISSWAALWEPRIKQSASSVHFTRSFKQLSFPTLSWGYIFFWTPHVFPWVVAATTRTDLSLGFVVFFSSHATIIQIFCHVSQFV